MVSLEGYTTLMLPARYVSSINDFASEGEKAEAGLTIQQNFRGKTTTHHGHIQER